MRLNGASRFHQIQEIEEIEDDHQLLSEIEDRDDENQESRADEDFLSFEQQYAKMIKDQLGTLLIDYIDQRDGKKVINDKTHQYITMKETMDEFVKVKKQVSGPKLRKVNVNFNLTSAITDRPEEAAVKLDDLDFVPVLSRIHIQNLKIEGSNVLYCNDLNIERCSSRQEETIVRDILCSNEPSENSFEIIQKLREEDDIDDEV